METVIKKLPNSQVEIKATFDTEEWKKAQTRALNRIAAQASIPGFRRGKAPLNLIRKRIGNAAILEEALNIVLQESYEKVFVENDVRPITQPQANVDTMDKDNLVMTFTTTVVPEVTLGEYKGLEVAKDTVEVTDEEINARLESIQEENAELLIREEGAEAVDGDTVVIDYAGTVDGVEFDGGKAENYELTLGSDTFIPGFEAQVVGMKSNETKDITVTFPEDYHADDLAGKEAVFNVTVHEIKYKVLPEIDDDLALDADIDGVETLDQLKDQIKADLYAQKDRAANSKFESDLLDKVVENSPVEVPEVMVEEQLQNMVSELSANLSQQGINLDTYLQITNKTMDDIKADIRDQAEQRVKLNLVLSEIVKAENITVSDDDVDAEYQDIAAAYSMDIEEVKKILGGQEAGLRSDIATRKAIELIKNSVQ